MPIALPIDNAIAYAHFQLRGGWRNIAITSGGYVVLVGMLVYVTGRLNPDSASTIYYGWTMGLLGLQAGILLLFGSITLNAALRLDLVGGMIESHRLMPLPPLAAISGYAVGATCQASGLAVANYLLGALVASAANISLARWTNANLVLATFSVFIWVLSIYAAFLGQSSMRWIVSMAVAGLSMTHGYLLALLPGLMLLISPLIGHTIFVMRNDRADLHGPYVLALAAQVFIGAICFIGAARKYRRSDTQALGLWLGLLLLGGWLVISGVAITFSDDFYPVFMRYSGVGDRARLSATALTAILLALVPVGAASARQLDWRRRKALGDPSLGPKPPMPILGTVVCVLLIGLFLRTLGWVTNPQVQGNVAQEIESVGPLGPNGHLSQALVLLYAVAVVTGALLSTGYVLRIRQRTASKTFLAAGGWILCSWILPVLADLIMRSYLERQQVLTSISAASPAASMFLLYTEPSFDMKPLNFGAGIAIQLGCALLIMAYFYATDGTRRRAARS